MKFMLIIILTISLMGKDPKTIELTNLITLLPNDIGYIDNTICYHKIYNPEPFQAYSLHIYSPPNFNMSIY